MVVSILILLLLSAYVIYRDIAGYKEYKKCSDRQDIEYMSALINVKKYMIESGYTEEAKEIENIINELIQRRYENSK